MTNSLTQSIVHYLNLNGFECWRQNTIGLYDPKKGVFRKNPQQKVGIPDIIGYRKADGRFIGVEIKNGSDTLSLPQQIFLRELRQAGGIAMVVGSVDEFLQAMQYELIPENILGFLRKQPDSILTREICLKFLQQESE
jgi:VRR-NUC domain